MPFDVCVIFNPLSGRGRAAARMARLQHLWASRAVFWPTTHAGHAEQLAVKAATDGFAMVVAAGGDGTVHEVANGLLTAVRPEVTFAVVPIGSANDYAYSLGIENGAMPHGPRRLVDVGLVQDAAGRQRHFVCCLGLGFNGLVTLESRKIHGLQGMALYGFATLRALLHYQACPAMAITMDEGLETTRQTLMLSVLIGRREGGFVLAPDARLDDGLFDYVHAGNLSRLEILQLLPRLALFGTPKNHREVQMGRCRRIKVRSPSPLAVHVDGELFARPEDNVRELEITIRPRALRVQTG
jgi:diacylglycerol kinase (ATP)